jgi:hypothetical protein
MEVGTTGTIPTIALGSTPHCDRLRGWRDHLPRRAPCARKQSMTPEQKRIIEITTALLDENEKLARPEFGLMGSLALGFCMVGLALLLAAMSAWLFSLLSSIWQ